MSDLILSASSIIIIHEVKALRVAMAPHEGFCRTFDDCGVTEAAVPFVQLSFFDLDHFRVTNWRVGQMLGKFRIVYSISFRFFFK